MLPSGFYDKPSVTEPLRIPCHEIEFTKYAPPKSAHAGVWGECQAGKFNTTSSSISHRHIFSSHLTFKKKVKISKNTLTNIGFCIIAALIALCLAELLVRIVIYDPNSELTTDIIWKAQKTNVEFDKNRGWSKVGQTHFREEPISGMFLQKEFLRILFLGDSFTAGTGINNREDRFTDIIETQLNRDMIDDRLPFKNVHIFNAAKAERLPVIGLDISMLLNLCTCRISFWLFSFSETVHH